MYAQVYVNYDRWLYANFVSQLHVHMYYVMQLARYMYMYVYM